MADPQKFRRKPVTIEAVEFVGSVYDCHGRWDGRYPDDWDDLRRFARGSLGVALVGSKTHGGPNEYLPAIHAAEGTVVVHTGDWVIRNEAGFYPVKPKAFHEAYELVGEASDD